MSIATEIEQLQKNLTDSYTAVQTKGGVVPAAKGYTNLPAAITSIPTGGGGGPTWSDPHQVDTAGRLTLGNTGTANFTGIKTIADKALWRCNKRNDNVTSALFPDLEVVEDAEEITSYGDLLTKASALGEAFMFASALTALKMPKLRKIGKAGLSRMAALSTSVEDVFTVYGEYGDWSPFPELEEVGDFGLVEAFRWSKALQYAAENAPDGTILFPKLKTLGNDALRTLFGQKPNTPFPDPDGSGQGAGIVFPALTTVDATSFLNMFNGFDSGSIHLHFLPALETAIKACTGYPQFGANGTVNIYFDADQYVAQ